MKGIKVKNRGRGGGTEGGHEAGGEGGWGEGRWNEAGGKHGNKDGRKVT